jgi:hypothetical protein
MKINPINRLIISALVCHAFFSTSAPPCKAGQQAPASAGIEATIRQFWAALGDLNFEAIKQLLDWPAAIIETSATGARSAVIVHSAAELDEEFKRVNPDPANPKKRGDFYGLEVKNIRVEMLNEGLAYVAYRCELKKELLPKATRHAPEDEFVRGLNVITVLRRDQEAKGNQWKIVLVNVPK